jgi:ABC-2 type transport system ATP-binding protein
VLVSARLRAERTVAEVMERGIQGYLVQLAGSLPDHLVPAGVVSRSDDLHEVYVAREDFSEFMARLAACRCTVSLVEPRRKDLEDFFLDIVRQGDA